MEKDVELALEARLSRQMLVGEILARNAFQHPDREAFVLGQSRLSYESLDRRVNQLANGLLAKGIGKGDKVALLMKNRQELLEIFFAAAKIGAVNVPVNVRLAASEIAYILTNCDARILFTEDGFIERIAAISDHIGAIRDKVLIGSSAQSGYLEYESLMAMGSTRRPPVYVEDEQDAFIIYTAGTTGKPKGAVLTHKNMVCNCVEVIHASGLSAPRRPDLPPLDPKTLVVAPLFHVAGIMNILRTMLSLNTAILRDFEPVGVLETIAREKITHLFLVPAMWRILLDHPDFARYDRTSLRAAGYGADITPNSLKNRILQGFLNASLFEAFGQTEMSATTIFMKHQDALRKEGSVGLPFRMVNIRVVDDLMNDVAVGQVGEIVYRAPSMFKGYYNNPRETEKAFEGGWFHSGDLVRRDEEGFVYVVDRKKDMILSGGENIYSAEVEEILRQFPKIKEAAVIGVADPKWGEAVKAFVVLRSEEQATAEDIMGFCREKLAKFKCPKYVEFIDALPRSATGKVLKRLLRDKGKG